MSSSGGSLFVVATPIGNLEDISLRALRVLREVDLIAAEHVPVARTLLRHFDIATNVVPYHDAGDDAMRLLQRMQDGDSIALVSDAGTPGVSDPGRELINAALKARLRVVPIPGAAAPIALWSVSGLTSPEVAIYGFLPRKRSQRRAALLELLERSIPTLLFEAPHRLLACLSDMELVMPAARLIVGRELTKLHEQIWRGTPAEASEAFLEPRGEFTILVIPPDAANTVWSDADIANALAEAASQGASRSQAAKFVAQQSGRPRRDIYRLWPFESAG